MMVDTDDDPLTGVHLATTIIAFCTGTLSLVSSIILLRKIRHNVRPHQRQVLNNKPRPRDQILVGLCYSDIINSFGLLFWTLPGPAGLETDYKTIGTVGTCTAQGFLVQLGSATPVYNAALCLYFLMAVRYRISDDWIRKRFVPVVHFVIVAYIGTGGIYGLVTDAFNFDGFMGCWATGVDAAECEQVPETCGRGENVINFLKWFGIFHVMVSFGTVIVSMLILCLTVRQTERRSQQWRFNNNNNNNNNNTSNRRNNSSRSSSRNMDSSVRSTSIQRDGAAAGGSTSFVVSEQPRRRQSTSSASSSRTLTSQTVETGLMYSFVFILTYVPWGVLFMYDFDPDAPVYNVFLILNAFFMPLQGFLNLLIYTSSDRKSWWQRHTSNGAFCWGCFNCIRSQRQEEEQQQQQSALRQVSDTILPASSSGADVQETTPHHNKSVSFRHDCAGCNGGEGGGGESPPASTTMSNSRTSKSTTEEGVVCAESII